MAASASAMLPAALTRPLLIQPHRLPDGEGKTVGSVTSDNLVELLNAWTSADGGAKWRKWVLNTTAEGIERTGGKYPNPSQAYPGYSAETPVYKDSVPMETLYESQSDAQPGICYQHRRRKRA